jgi:hypothetical protein
MEELQQLLAGTAVWVAVDTLGEAAHSLCLELAAGDRPETRQTLDHQAREMRRCLATAADTPLDRLFAQRAALARLETYSVHEALVQLKDLTVYPSRFLVRHEEESCRRHRAAVQGLRHLRRLRKPEERAVQSPT